MNVQPKDHWQWQSQTPSEDSFYYFAYGSCMCPVDLKRTLGENTHPYVIGPAILKGYRVGFYWYSPLRQCGALDVVPEATGCVEGVLYQLPWRLSSRLDEREYVKFNHQLGIHVGGYRPEIVDVYCQGQRYSQVRTYVVTHKLREELAPNDWYFQVVMRGAITCGLTEEYCWKLFEHIHKLQQKQQITPVCHPVSHPINASESDSLSR